MSFSLDKLGNQFVQEEIQNIKDRSIFDNVKLIGVYIGADWAVPCQRFLPTLIEFYNYSNEEQKQIEIIYISMDNQQSVFENVLKQLPFPALSWENVQRYKIYLLLKEKIAGIPAFIVFDKEGNLIALNGRGQIEKNKECIEQWISQLQ